MTLNDLLIYYNRENKEEEFTIRGSNPKETVFHQIGEVWIDRAGSKRVIKARELYDDAALKILKVDRVIGG